MRNNLPESGKHPAVRMSTIRLHQKVDALAQCAGAFAIRSGTFRSYQSSPCFHLAVLPCCRKCSRCFIFRLPRRNCPISALGWTLSRESNAPQDQVSDFHFRRVWTSVPPSDVLETPRGVDVHGSNSKDEASRYLNMQRGGTEEHARVFRSFLRSFEWRENSSWAQVIQKKETNSAARSSFFFRSCRRTRQRPP